MLIILFKIFNLCGHTLFGIKQFRGKKKSEFAESTFLVL